MYKCTECGTTWINDMRSICPKCGVLLPIEDIKSAGDPVNHPKGYNQGTIEFSDYAKDQSLDFFEGNVVKYVVRHKVKNGLEDLKKAQWYLNYMVEHYDGK